MKWTEDRLNEITSDESRANVIRVMEKYGDNKWWESDDPTYIAQYQLFESTLMVDFSVFYEGIENLLDRPVWMHVFGINANGLREAARIAIYRRGTGSSYIDASSDEQRDREIVQSINSLYDVAAAKNRQVVVAALFEE